MLVQSGLYYPYIHIRSDAWLKLTALYWQRMDRIVPRNYPLRDSRTARILNGELGFIRQHHPGRAAVDTSILFIDLLTERGRELVQQLQVQPSEADLTRQYARPRDGGVNSRGSIGYIYAEKMTSELIDVLSMAGLAFGASGEQGDNHRRSMAAGSADWIGMDSRLAAAYMTVLARLTARHFDLNPVTNDPRVHIAMDGLSVDAIFDAILRRGTATAETLQVDLQQRVAVLAIESVIPRSISLVDVCEIVRFRQAHEHELGAFQAAVSSAAEQVASLPADIDSGTLQERVNEVTQRYLLEPRSDLKRALSLFGLETRKSVLTIQAPLIASGGTIVGAYTSPAVGLAAGAAAIVASFGAIERSRHRSLKKSEAAANYLLELRSNLTTEGVVKRQLRSIRGH